MMRSYSGNPSASLLGKGLGLAGLCREGEGQWRLKRCWIKSTGRYQVRESLARVKPAGWSPARGMGAGKDSRVGLGGEGGAGLW